MTWCSECRINKNALFQTAFFGDFAYWVKRSSIFFWFSSRKKKFLFSRCQIVGKKRQEFGPEYRNFITIITIAISFVLKE